MVPRLYESGGSLPRDIRDFATQGWMSRRLFARKLEGFDFYHESPFGSRTMCYPIRGEVCDMTGGKKNPRTYDIAQRIMQEEIEHEAWFIELLSKRPVWALQEKLSRTITIYISCRWTQPPLIFFKSNYIYIVLMIFWKILHIDKLEPDNYYLVLWSSHLNLPNIIFPIIEKYFIKPL